MTPQEAIDAVMSAGLHAEAAVLREAVANPMGPVVEALLRAQEAHSERTAEAIDKGMAGMASSITAQGKATSSAINRATVITGGIVIVAMMLVGGAMGVSSYISDGQGRSVGVTAPGETSRNHDADVAP